MLLILLYNTLFSGCIVKCCFTSFNSLKLIVIKNVTTENFNITVTSSRCSLNYYLLSLCNKCPSLCCACLKDEFMFHGRQVYNYLLFTKQNIWGRKRQIQIDSQFSVNKAPLD